MVEATMVAATMVAATTVVATIRHHPAVATRSPPCGGQKPTLSD